MGNGIDSIMRGEDQALTAGRREGPRVVAAAAEGGGVGEIMNRKRVVWRHDKKKAEFVISGFRFRYSVVGLLDSDRQTDCLNSR